MSRSRARLLGLAVLATALASAAPAQQPAAPETAAPATLEQAAGGGAPVSLEGTWYVLVHYQDADSGKPDAWRWEDRVWRFARAGDRLEWTEWPIVVLDDESGRFESLGTNRQARVVEAWEPSASQLDDIRNGVQVNSRGSRTKTLRAAGDGGAWRTTGSALPESASVITYTEDWSIDGLPDRPVFTREDSLGSARTESMEGRTVYRTEQVLAAGDELRGSFARDESRRGTFRMIRSGETEKVRGSGLTQGQRLMRMFASQVGIELGAADLEALADDRVAPGTELPPEVRADLREQIRDSVEQAYREQGQDPQAFAPQIEAFTDEIERLLLDEGKSVEEVQRMLQAGEIEP